MRSYEKSPTPRGRSGRAGQQTKLNKRYQKIKVSFVMHMYEIPLLFVYQRLCLVIQRNGLSTFMLSIHLSTLNAARNVP